MIQPHEIEWTPERITRFWDWLGAQPAMQSLYFSRGRGDAILDAARKHVGWNTTVLDLGAGPGYLTEKLLARGARVWAADTSADAVAALKRRMSGQRNFLGACQSTIEQVPLPDALADVVFSIETIEHLDDRALTSMLREISRLLKPRGKVVITTPNQENLAAAQVLCPECGGVFHRMQHMRSWSADTLSRTMQQFGLETLVCRATVFSLAPALVRPLNYWALVWSGMSLPHLLYVGQKS